MSSFEVFREKLICHLARLLGIELDGQDLWGVWVIIHERCPEAARIASEQWLQKDLLLEHLQHTHQMPELNTGTAINLKPKHDLYSQRWQCLDFKLREAVAKVEALEKQT